MAHLLVLALDSETRRTHLVTDDRVIPMKWAGKYDPHTPVKGIYKEPKDMYEHQSHPEWYERRRGDIIEIRKDICAFGRMERLPRFYRIHAPSISMNFKETMETPYVKYQHSEIARNDITDNPIIDQLWKNYYIDFNELNAAQNQYLETTGELTLNSFEVARVIKGKKIPFDPLNFGDTSSAGY